MISDEVRLKAESRARQLIDFCKSYDDGQSSLMSDLLPPVSFFIFSELKREAKSHLKLESITDSNPEETETRLASLLATGLHCANEGLRSAPRDLQEYLRDEAPTSYCIRIYQRSQGIPETLARNRLSAAISQQALKSMGQSTISNLQTELEGANSRIDHLENCLADYEAEADQKYRDQQAEIERVAKIKDPIKREQQIKAIAKHFGVTSKAMTGAVKELQGSYFEGQGGLVESIVPWDGEVDGSQLAQEIMTLFKQHVILTESAYRALTIWAMATYVYDQFGIFPRLCLGSPEKKCGKTTTLECLHSIVSRAISTSNITPATIFRVIEKCQPTLLIDEADTFLNSNEELRGIVNSGHKKSCAYVMRTEEVGGVREPCKFSTWSPMCIAMIKAPPGTIADRSIMLRLKRKLTTEKVERVPVDLVDLNVSLRQKLQRWAETVKLDPDPAMPDLGNDRAVDNWIPLISIASSLDDDWLRAVKQAMSEIEKAGDDDQSISELLLADIYEIFRDEGIEKIHSQKLVNRLAALDDKPWREWRQDKPLTTNTLARLLKPFSIKSKQIKIDGENRHGYSKDQFSDSWSRYSIAKTTEALDTPFQNATPLPPNGNAGCGLAVYSDGVLSELLYGLYHQGTSNTAELNALYHGLQIAGEDSGNVHIFTDSKYAINCITKWANGWKAKNWQRRGGRPIRNLDIIQGAFELFQQINHRVEVCHVRGHMGIEGNELADRMSVLAIDQGWSDLRVYGALDTDSVLAK